MKTSIASTRTSPISSTVVPLLCGLVALAVPRAMGFDWQGNADDFYSDSGNFKFGLPLNSSTSESFPTHSGTFVFGTAAYGSEWDENTWESWINFEPPSAMPPWESIELLDMSSPPLVLSFEIGVPDQTYETMEFWGDQVFRLGSYSREYIIDFQARTTFDYDGEDFWLHGTWNYTATLVGETGVPPSKACTPDTGTTWVLLLLGLAGLHRLRRVTG